MTFLCIKFAIILLVEVYNDVMHDSVAFIGYGIWFGNIVSSKPIYLIIEQIDLEIGDCNLVKVGIFTINFEF